MKDSPLPLKQNLRKIFIGNLPLSYSEREVIDYVKRFGKIHAVEAKSRFVFVEFDHEDAAIEAVRQLNGSYLFGATISVQPHRITTKSQHLIPVLKDRRTEYRVIVFNLDERVSWQDLKDFGRQAGEVNFANVYKRNGAKLGIIEYYTSDGFRIALEELPSTRLYDKKVLVEEDRGQTAPLTDSFTRGNRWEGSHERYYDYERDMRGSYRGREPPPPPPPPPRSESRSIRNRHEEMPDSYYNSPGGYSRRYRSPSPPPYKRHCPQESRRRNYDMYERKEWSHNRRDNWGDPLDNSDSHNNNSYGHEETWRKRPRGVVSPPRDDIWRDNDIRSEGGGYHRPRPRHIPPPPPPPDHRSITPPPTSSRYRDERQASSYNNTGRRDNHNLNHNSNLHDYDDNNNHMNSSSSSRNRGMFREDRRDVSLTGRRKVASEDEDGEEYEGVYHHHHHHNNNNNNNHHHHNNNNNNRSTHRSSNDPEHEKKSQQYFGRNNVPSSQDEANSMLPSIDENPQVEVDDPHTTVQKNDFGEIISTENETFHNDGDDGVGCDNNNNNNNTNNTNNNNSNSTEASDVNKNEEKNDVCVEEEDDVLYEFRDEGHVSDERRDSCSRGGDNRQDDDNVLVEIGGLDNNSIIQDDHNNNGSSIHDADTNNIVNVKDKKNDESRNEEEDSSSYVPKNNNFKNNIDSNNMNDTINDVKQKPRPISNTSRPRAVIDGPEWWKSLQSKHRPEERLSRRNNNDNNNNNNNNNNDSIMIQHRRKNSDSDRGRNNSYSSENNINHNSKDISMSYRSENFKRMGRDSESNNRDSKITSPSRSNNYERPSDNNNSNNNYRHNNNSSNDPVPSSPSYGRSSNIAHQPKKTQGPNHRCNYNKEVCLKEHPASYNRDSRRRPPVYD